MIIQHARQPELRAETRKLHKQVFLLRAEIMALRQHIINREIEHEAERVLLQDENDRLAGGAELIATCEALGL